MWKPVGMEKLSEYPSTPGLVTCQGKSRSAKNKIEFLRERPHQRYYYAATDNAPIETTKHAARRVYAPAKTKINEKGNVP
ncbi:hypothetical protein E4U40_006763 [Claviceps sp. LM458 group G5]|nr:hypothetical protein E4U40_006763 [Claviceps sp. LM458 group G5]